jgi:protocatechuate 3,4-dioxygenase beta subunit
MEGASMRKGMVLSVALVLGAVFVLWALMTPRQPTAAGRLGREGPRPPASRASSELEEVDRGESSRVAVEFPTASDEEPADEAMPVVEPASGLVGVHGRVIDVAGRPVPNVEVCGYPVATTGGAETAESTTPWSTSGPDGSFELVVSRGGLLVRARSEGFATVFGGIVPDPPAGANVLVVVAPRIGLAGEVLNESQAAVPGARVAVDVPENLLVGLDAMRDYSARVTPHTLTGIDGRFELSAVPRIAGAGLVVTARGYLPTQVPLDTRGDQLMTIVLEEPAAVPELMYGHVFDRDGDPVADAVVSLEGGMAVGTDGNGRFVLDLRHPVHAALPLEEPLVIWAVKPGYLPAERQLPSLEEEREAGWPRDVVLWLVDPALSIEGVVVDHVGRPSVGYRIAPIGTTTLGIVERGVESGVFSLQTIEAVAGGSDRASTRTDERGAFSLRGLGPRSYSIEVLDPATLFAHVTEPVPAGTMGLRVVLPAVDVGAIGGVVRGVFGRTMKGVAVQALSGGPAAEAEQLSALPGRIGGPRAVTAEDGAFKLDGVALGRIVLRVESPEIVNIDLWAPPPGVPLDSLEIEVQRRCHFAVDWGDLNDPAVEVRFVDAADRTLPVYAVRGRDTWKLGTLRAGDECDVLVVGETVTSAVWSREGAELARIPFALTPGKIGRLSF